VRDVKHGDHMSYECGSVHQYRLWIAMMQAVQAREMAMGRRWPISAAGREGTTCSRRT
jgi:hypothetical protein